MLTSPERRRPGTDNDRTPRPPPIPSAYPSEHSRERPPLLPPSREALRPYDRERDWVREQQHEIDRPHERERRWSLSEQRRFDYDRRPLDADRRPPSYDRRPPHLDDKRPSGYVDRRPLDDRRFPPDYDRRPLPEESRFGIAPSQDIPTQEPRAANGSERRLSVTQAMKTGGPTPAPLASSSATPTSTTGTAAHALTPAPVDSAAVSVHSSPAPMSVDGQRNSNARFVDERSSTQVASSQDRVSGTQPQLVPRAEPTPTRPGVLLSSKPPENTGIATVVDDLPHARVSEPPHPDRFSISAAPVTTAVPPSTAAVADDRSRPVSAAASHALSVGREESRHQPQPPPPPLPRASSPSGVPSAHPSLSLRAREPSTVRSYFRPEVSRPSEDDRRLDMHHLPHPPPPPPPPPAGDSYRRYDERSRWSPPPPPSYADRRGYYDRDRDRDRDRYWENNNNNKGYRSPPPRDRDRDRDRPYAPQPPHPPPPHWDRSGRAARYSEAPYAPDRRFTDDRDRSDNRERWYAQPPPPPPPVPASSTLVGRPASFDNNNNPPSSSSSYVQRGGGGGALQRPRSPSSPPPHKRARGEDGYAIIPGPGSVPPSSVAAVAPAGVGTGPPTTQQHQHQQAVYEEYAQQHQHQQGVPIPVPIPIGMRAPSRSPPPRYAHAPHLHARPMHMEPYGPYGTYEREGGGARGPPGAAYAREGPR